MTHHSYTPSCILITGATGDFGIAMAQRYDALGAKLILHGRSEDKLNAVAANLKSDIHLMIFDCLDEQSIEDAFEALPGTHKDIDLLVNNAGGARGLGKFPDSALQDNLDMIGMNVTSLVSITQRVIKGMAERKKGHIVNIGSIAGNWPYPGGHVYCASKAFVKQFSLAIRADLEGTNIRVTNIEPGMAETEFSLKRFKGDAEKARAVYANTDPLTADDIAECVFWSTTLPPHVNINTLEVMPQKQTFSALSVERD